MYAEHVTALRVGQKEIRGQVRCCSLITTGQNLIITPDFSAWIETPLLCLEWGPVASEDVEMVPHP